MPTVIVTTPDELKSLIQAELKPLHEAITRLSANDPKPVEPEPEQPVEPAPEPEQPELPIAAQFRFVDNDKDEWRNGVSTTQTRFFLQDTPEARAQVKAGRALRFADGQVRTVIEAKPIYNNILVTVDGDQLIDTSMGHPNTVSVSGDAGEADQEGELPATKPEPVPDHVPGKGKGGVYLNLGLGMGGDGPAGGLPGKHGTHYNFPNLDEWKQAAAQGFKRARVGFLWERAIRGGAGSGQLDEAHMKLMDQTASYAAQVGMTILWDMHNYTGYSTTNTSKDRKKIGAGVSIEALGNDWKVIAQRLESNATTKAVTYGYDLMNEPIIGWDVWKRALQHAVTEVGNISDKVLACEGIAYSSTINWVKNNPGMENITHPKGKQYLEFHGHMYLDERSSGFYTTAQDNKDQFDPQTGPKRIASAQAWAERHKVKFCVGEVNVPGRLKTAVVALDNTLGHNVQNGIDTYVFYAARGAGNSEHNINHSANKPTLDVILKWVNA